MTEEKIKRITFSFGKNWEEFVRLYFREEKVEQSKRYLLEFLELPDLKGKYFLDIGCGSGLHSLAACLAGAERVVSFDIDPYSVSTTEKIREIYGRPFNWTVLQGSILDQTFLQSIEPADIVYSWGVLHHTGKMWEALKNTARLMKEHGLLYIALYTTDAKSNYWLEVKKKYNEASPAGKRLMEWRYILTETIIPSLLHFKNPLKTITGYRKRGMSYYTDIKDWLGGYPFEHAKIEEVFHFCRKQLGLELINIKTGEANTEYLFKKQINIL